MENIRKHQEILRYLVMAVVLVSLEILAFWILNSLLGVWYVVSTIVSASIAIILNWYLSRRFVFTHRAHTIVREFWLVVAGSVVGIALQIVIISLLVSLLHAPALAGKTAAIFLTFIWNFWFRKRFVFYQRA